MTFYELFLEQFNDYELDSSTENRSKALKTGFKLLSVQSDLYQVKELLYKLLLSDYLSFSSNEKFTELQLFFTRYNELAFSNLAPPHFVKALTHYYQQSANKNEIVAWLKNAIRENPTFKGSYELLAEIYSAQEYRQLALYNYQKAFRLAPHDLDLGKQLSWAYSDIIYSDSCISDMNSHLNTALQHAKEMMKKHPQESEFQFDVASYYQLKGQNRLFLYSAKKLAQNDEEYIGLYKDSLLWNGQLKELDLLFSSSKASPEEDFSNKLYSSIMKKDWNGLIELKELVALVEQPSVFEISYLGMVLKHRYGDSAANDFFIKNQNRFEVNYWNKTFFQYASGQISADSLLAKAATACEKTEAYFALALNNLLEGRLSEAKLKLETIQSLKISAYYENAVSNYWLEHW